MNVVSLRLCTSKIFSSCALQTFLIPLTHNLAKVPHQLFLPFLDRLRRHRCLRSSIAQRRSPELHAKRRDSQACSDFAQSTDKAALRAFSREEFCSRAESWSCGRALSTVKRSVEVHHNIAHCTRDRLLYCIQSCCARALAAWCKFDSSSLASWAREGTHGNHKMAICSGAASQSFRSTVREGRRKLVFMR